MNKPDFIIIGCQRCGTTSLWNYLNEHPKINPAIVKETHYFNRFFNRGKQWYESNFPACKKGEITGEGTPFYFYYEYAPERIFETYGNDIKFIVLMRDPVDRAYSHFKLNKRRWKKGNRMKHEPLEDFEDAIQMEPIRLEGKEPGTFEQFVYSYLSKGLYAKQIERWFKIFKPENFLFVKSEDLFEDTQNTYDAIIKFLGLKKHKLKEILVHNATEKKDMNPETREKLEEYFKEPNKDLYNILGIDFKWGKR